MSIKGFLEVQEMQTGGMLQQSFTGPFANQSRRNPSGEEYIPPSYELPKPPTITLPPIAPITPTPTEDLTNFSPDPNYMGSIDMTLAQAGADRDNLGPLNPHWSQEFLSTLEARGRPETDLSRALDKGFSNVLAPALAAVSTINPAVALGTTLFSAFTGKGIVGSLISAGRAGQTSAPQTAPQAIPQTAPQTAPQAIPQTPAQQFAAATGNNYALGVSRGTAAPAVTVTAAQAGSDPALFGAAYGQGRGGKGMFSSFAHYSAGLNEAEESQAVATGVTNEVFTSIEQGSQVVDSLVSRGYNQAEIEAIAGGNLTEGNTSLAALTAGEALEDAYGGGGASSPGKVICQELYDQGLLEHSIYSLDEQFGEHLRKHDSDLLEGYHTWAYDVVNAMRKSKTITHIVRIVSRPVVKHIAYKMGYPSKTLLGAVMFNVGAFVCRRLAKKETVYA